MKERRQKVDSVQLAVEAFKSSSNKNKNKNVSCIFKEDNYISFNKFSILTSRKDVL